MSNAPLSLNICNHRFLSECSKSTSSAVICLATGIALAAIAALTVGILAQQGIIVGLNSITQWTLMGLGACVTLIATVVGVVSSFYHTEREDFQQLTLDDFEKQLNAIMSQENDLLAATHQLAKMIPLDKLQELVREKFPDCPDALQTAKGMVGQARSYLALRDGIVPSIRARLMSIFDTLIAVIDSIFVAFGIADFFEMSESKIQGEFKFQKIMMLISFFTLLTATLLPMLGVTTSASIVGGLLLFLAVMSVIWPHIRPLPSRIPEGENWSKQVREGKLATIGGRKKAVKDIARALTNKQHPLLIGPSGIGKTQTVQAFVQGLERGDFPELQGKTVFYFNTANLVTSKEVLGGGNKILKRISETIGSHRNNCILVLDEIHLAYQENKSSAIGEQLKTFLDEKEDNFPYVIGLTTEEEYYRDIYKDNSAGDRRFEKIEITNTNPADTIAILNQYLIQKAPDAIVEKKALKDLVEKTAEGPQPLAARKILSQCVKKTTHLGGSPKSREVEEMRGRLEKAHYKSVVLGGTSLTTESKRAQKIADLEKNLASLEKELKEEEKKLHQLAYSKKTLVQVREAKFRAALQISDLDSERNRETLSEFLLLKFFLEGAIEASIVQQTEALKVKAVIDKVLIDEVLAEEKMSLDKRTASLERGKQQLVDRSH